MRTANCARRPESPLKGFRRALRITVAALLCLAAAPAWADFLIQYDANNPAFAVAIDGLVVDGVAYNVTFSDLSVGTGDTTFLGNNSGANDAAVALIDLFNGVASVLAVYQNSVADEAFLVSTGKISETVLVGVNVLNPNMAAGGWVVGDAIGNWSGSCPYAVFTAESGAAVPEPTSLALLATGLALLVGPLRRRHRLDAPLA